MIAIRCMLQVKCYLGMGHEREEVTSIGVGGYFGETALLRNEPTKVIDQNSFYSKGFY